MLNGHNVLKTERIPDIIWSSEWKLCFHKANVSSYSLPVLQIGFGILTMLTVLLFVCIPIDLSQTNDCDKFSAEARIIVLNF